MTTETPNDHLETVSYQEEAARILASRFDHFDALLHEQAQQLAAITAHLDKALAFIDQHKPALTRGLGMLDAGSKMRGFLGGGKHGKGHDGEAST